MESNAGWYVGYATKKGEPYSRESVYFRTKAGATALLKVLRA